MRSTSRWSARASRPRRSATTSRAAAATSSRATSSAGRSTPTPPRKTSSRVFRQGAKAALPVVLGYLGIGFAAGVVERAAGMSYAEILLISTVLYAGSAQFVVTGMLGSPAAAIVLTVFFLNLRHLLLSAALAPALRAVPAWKNALLGLQLTDETFVVASSQPRLSAAWMAGLNLAAWSTWAVANLAGAALSAYAGDTRALAFALPAMFAGLLVLQMRMHSGFRI